MVPESGSPSVEAFFFGRAGGRTGAAVASRGSTSATSLAAKAERSASNCPALSLLSVGLKTKDETPICRARRRSDWLRLSVIMSTGGRRFIFHSRFTTSKPPWNDAPPEAGIPRSVTRTKGPSLARRREAAFAASSGPPASMTSNPAASKWRARIARTSSSSSTSRIARAASGSGSTTGRGEGGGGGGEGGGASGSNSTFGSGRVSVPYRSTGAACHCCGVEGTGSDGSGAKGSSSGSANEASTAAADWARSSSSPSARSRSIS